MSKCKTMKAGDLVKVVQSERDTLITTFKDETGIIVSAHLGKFSNQDSFSVMIRDKFHIFGANYLEVVGVELSDKQLEEVCGGMSYQKFHDWRVEKLNEDR